MTPLVVKALEFATRAHAGHTRKGGQVPYIVHPMAVSRLLMELGASPELAAAALLHDTVEDVGITVEQLREQFGERVAQLVELASEPEKYHSWQFRKQHTLENLQKTEDVELLMLVCADKYDNLAQMRRDLEVHGDSVWGRFTGERAQQAWYFHEMVKTFQERLTDPAGKALAGWLEEEVGKVFGLI